MFLSAVHPREKEIYILHTNNTNGALENCLCPGKSYGSLEKRVHYISDWFKNHPNTVLVDAGDFLSATGNVLKDSIAFRAYELMPYHAMGLGDQEFFRGVDFLSSLIELSPLPFIASNLTAPIMENVKSERIVEKGGVTFGILSVMKDRLFDFYPAEISEAVSVAPVESIILEKVNLLKNKTDVVVVLSHLGFDDDLALAESVPEIDVIIGSHTQTVLASPEKVGNTLIVQAGKDGYYVGELKLTFDENKNITDYEGQLVPMDISLPNDPKVVRMIVDYNRLQRQKAKKVVERISPIPGDYIVSASENCGSCHPNQFEHWMESPHSRSFTSLKEKHKEKSPACLACHTTGFGRDDGYLNYNITAGLKNVNCTECHYVSREHLRQPVFSPAVVITEETCIRCHDQGNSPNFDFVAYLSKIRHPKPVVASGDPDGVIMNIVVKPGDTLWSIAEKLTDDGTRWVELYEFNRNVIENPHKIFPGQVLKVNLPEKNR